MKDVAPALRAAVRDSEFNFLSTDVTMEKIVSGEIKVPDVVLQLFTFLLIGPGCRTSASSSKIRRVNSISDDVVFSMSSGRKKQSNNLKLCLAMKSLTGSKKVIEVLNHYGHCPSYTTIEELETELTLSSNS